MIETCSTEPFGVGGLPMLPAETSTFCSRIAAMMSEADSERAAARSGSIQMRIA